METNRTVHDCTFEVDHDGGVSCPVCGRYEDDDRADMEDELAQACYEMELRPCFVGPAPKRYNRGCPEASAALNAVAGAIKPIIEAHGFTFTGIGYGVKRRDPDPDYRPARYVQSDAR